jgi:hypothetical protein
MYLNRARNTISQYFLRKKPSVLLFRIFIKKNFRQLENLIKKSSETILEKIIIYISMRLHLLFPTVKPVALYLVSIKSYSKNTD